MKAHHDLSPSSFPALLECACYQSRGSRDSDSDRGDVIHAYLKALAVGETFSGEIDKADREDAEDVFGQVKELVDASVPGHTVFSAERRVHLYDEDLTEITFGTEDLFCRNTEVVVVADWKSGLDFDIESRNHWPQLDVYALAEMREHGIRQALCVIGFVKPKKILWKIRTYDECEATVSAVIARVEDQHKAPRACFACKMCRNLLWCPAILSRVELINDTLPVPVRQLDLPNPASIETPEQMAEALVWCEAVAKPFVKRVEQLCEEIKAAALVMIKTQDIPYFVRVSKAGQKTISNPQKAFELSGLDSEAFLRAVKVSLPKLAEEYAAKLGLAQKKARAEIEAVLSNIITTGEPSVELKRTDKKGF